MRETYPLPPGLAAEAAWYRADGRVNCTATAVRLRHPSGVEASCGEHRLRRDNWRQAASQLAGVVGLRLDPSDVRISCDAARAWRGRIGGLAMEIRQRSEQIGDVGAKVGDVGALCLPSGHLQLECSIGRYHPTFRLPAGEWRIGEFVSGTVPLGVRLGTELPDVVAEDIARRMYAAVDPRTW